MYLSELFSGIDFTMIQGKDREIDHLTIDSRTARKGSLFICIKGLTTDGHNYIDQAAKNGAAAVLCDRPADAYPAGLTVLSVGDSRLALNTVASNFYGKPEQSLFLIGVTGTNGKTSTTYFMETILKADGRKCGIIGTSGAFADGVPMHIPYRTATTPDTIELYHTFAEMKRLGLSYVLMEVSSHALALHKVAGLTFEAAIFTNLTQDHLDFHGTMENYLAAKEKLFQQCRWAVINADDDAAATLLPRVACRKITFGIEKKADLVARHIRYSDKGSRFELHLFGGIFPFILHIPGKFSVYNALGAIAVCLNLGISVRTVLFGVEQIQSVPGRIQAVPNTKDFNVFIDYAHSPDGLEQIIRAVRDFTQGRVITVFGCGGGRDKAKRPLMGRIAGELSDFCVLTSDNPRSEDPDTIIAAIESGMKETDCQYVTITDRKEAIVKAVQTAVKGDSVIIAGKGDERYQEFEQQRRVPFHDVTVAQTALEELK